VDANELRGMRNKFPSSKYLTYLDKPKGIKEESKEILATVIRVKKRKESKSEIMARLTPESSL
jgi:hypothetical protein